MRKIFFVTLIIMLIALFGGCNGNLVEKCEIEILRCSFDDQITASDEEYVMNMYEKKDGMIYVDLVVKIKNNGKRKIGEEDISGYFSYDGQRYDLQYAIEKETSTGFVTLGAIEPGAVGVIHMLKAVDEPAQNDELTVNASICGVKYEEKVLAKDESTPLDKKTKVSVGDKVSINGLYDVQVIECNVKNTIYAQNYAESEQYKPKDGKQLIDLVLKIKNNTDKNLEQFECYTIVDNELSKADVRIENDDNTEVKGLFTSPLKPSEEAYVHLICEVANEEMAKTSAIRFNLGGNCYYCNVAK